MALFGPELRIASRFSCETSQDAAPTRKVGHQLPPDFDAKRAHASLEVVLSTSGVAVRKVNENWYDLHVPDAPMLTSLSCRGGYAAEAARTQAWGRHRCLAVAGAAVVGAVCGLAMSGVGLAALAVAAAMGWKVAASAQMFAALCILNVPFDAALLSGIEWAGWAQMHGRLNALVRLCDVAARRPHVGVDFELRPGDEALVRAAQHGNDWLLQQAGLELELAQEPADAKDSPKPRKSA